MKKIMSVFSAVLLFLSVFSVNLNAESGSDIYGFAKDAILADGLENVPESSFENAEIFGEELSVENAPAFLDIGKIFSFIFKILTEILSSEKGYFISLAVILAVSFTADKLGEGLGQEKTLSAVRNITVLLVSVTAFFPLWNALSDGLLYGEYLSSFSVSLMPVFSALSTAAGHPSSALCGSSAIYFTVELFSWFVSAVVPPLVSVFLSAGVAAGFSGDSGMRKVSSVSRNIIISVVTVVYFIISAAAALQSGAMASSDGLAKKGLKFIVGTSVPIAGGFLSDGLDSVYAASSALTKNCGIFAVVAVFLAAAVPVLRLFICGLCMKVCSAISSLFKNSALENFFSVSFDAYLITLSFVLGYFVTVSVLISVTAGGI